jgi:hypothetical protein
MALIGGDIRYLHNKKTSTLSPIARPVASAGIRTSPSARDRVNIKLLFPKIGSA